MDKSKQVEAGVMILVLVIIIGGDDDDQRCLELRKEENILEENLYGMDKEFKIALMEHSVLGNGVGYHVWED
ncbi:hypothetical protein Tco_0469761 [Tanacetum coccineum]